ncbi:MAG: GNAT family N-acetyltransferase [Jannaschia sp.]
MIVRPLFVDDSDAWHEMMLSATRSHPAAFLLSSDEVATMSEEQVADTLARGHLHGIFDGSTLTGFAGLHLWRLDRLRHRADVGPFYIAPFARGTGAADRLLGALTTVARAEGVTWLDLWVAASNDRARAFYARNDFVEVARREDAVRMGEVSEDDVLMTRRLEARRLDG